MAYSASRVTRRAFLGRVAAGAVLLPAATRTSYAQSRSALVLGAGLAGLHAAWLLEREGYAVTILEARGRVGGRVFTLNDVPGKPEGGGEVIGENYLRLRAAAARVGVALEAIGPPRAPAQGLLLHIRGESIPVEQWSAAAGRFGLADSERSVPPTGLTGLYLRTGNPLKQGRDWIDPVHAELDRTSVAAWARARGASAEALRLMDVAPNCNSIDQASVLWAFRDAARRRDGGTQAFLVAGGASRLTDAMAASLAATVRTNHVVEQITIRPGGLEVRCANGRTLSAAVGVCTLPAPALRAITFSPALPAAQRAAIAALPYTAITKVMIDITQPFWERDGLPAQMWTDGPLERIFPITDGARIVGLRAWIDGKTAQAFDALTAADQRALVERELARVRPALAGAATVRSVVSWQRDPFAGGAYAHFAPGQIGSVRPLLARAADRMAFAGEHTAVEGAGMEAAFESAERAVRELLDRPESK